MSIIGVLAILIFMEIFSKCKISFLMFFYCITSLKCGSVQRVDFCWLKGTSAFRGLVITHRPGGLPRMASVVAHIPEAESEAGICMLIAI